MLIWWIPLALIVAVIIAVVFAVKKKFKAAPALPTHTPRQEEPSFVNTFFDLLSSWFPLQSSPATNGVASTGATNPHASTSTPTHRMLSPAVTAPPRAHNPQVRTHAAPPRDVPQVPSTAEDSNEGPSTGWSTDYNPSRNRYWQEWTIADRREREIVLNRPNRGSVATLPVYEPPPPSYTPQPISVPA